VESRRGDDGRERPIAEYWIVDPDREMVRVARPGNDDQEAPQDLVWRPAGAVDDLVIPVRSVFHD
jgi:Uma2 family endonuclease